MSTTRSIYFDVSIRPKRASCKMMFNLGSILDANTMKLVLFGILSIAGVISVGIIGLLRATGVSVAIFMTIFALISCNAAALTAGYFQLQQLRAQLKETKKSLTETNLENKELLAEIDLAKAREEGAQSTMDNVTKMLSSTSLPYIVNARST